MKKRPAYKPAALKILQQEIASKCPFCPRTDVAIFEVHHIDNKPENNELSNLLMLCPSCHEEITKEIRQYEEVVKKKLEISSAIKIEIDQEIKPLLDEIKKLLDENKLDEAEVIYLKAKSISDSKNDDYSRALLQRRYARILKEKYFNIEGEDELLLDCLKIFQKYKQEEDIAHTKELLAQTKASLGDLNSAEIFVHDFLEFAKQKGNNDELARAYIVVGYVYLQKDDLHKANEFMDEAIKFGTRLFLETDKEKKEEGSETITFAYHNKSFIYQRLGNIQEAKACALKALEGHRKLNKKPELGKMLFGLAELECYSGNFSDVKWKEYIEEAKSIFRELEDYSMLARCIDFVSRIAYSTGQRELSLKIFEDGYEEIKKTNDKRGIAHFLEQFVSYFLAQKNYDEAENYLNELIEFATKHNLDKSITRAYENLAKIAERKGDMKLRDELLNSVITSYENEYTQQQSPARKAYILGKISFVKEQLNDLIGALAIQHKVAKIFEELNITSEYAKTLLIITELKIKLGDRSKLLESWQKISQILEGTSFHEIASLAKINSGSYLLGTGEYEMAQRYLEESQQMIFKYKLRYAKEVEGMLEEVKQKREIANQPETSFPEMINLLYGAINSKKNPLEPTLRHWFYKFEKDLFKHFYNLEGLKCFFYSDDLETVKNISQNLSWLFDYFLIASYEKFEESKWEKLIYPYELIGWDVCFALIKKKDAGEDDEDETPASYEDILLHEINKPNKDGNFPRYIGTFEEKGTEITMPCFGWGRGLPSTSYELIRRNRADDIIRENYFVLHIDRHSLRDKFYTDILMAWEMKYIPIYFKEEVKSDSVSILSKIKTELPFAKVMDKAKASSTKKLLNSLLKATKENATTVLSDFKFDMDILFGVDKKKIQLTVMLVEISYTVRKIVYPVIVIENENKN